MQERKVCLIKQEVFEYPLKETLFRPSNFYPEYPFPEDISIEKNEVYDMVRQGLYLYGLDAENYGSRYWNPLGTYIKKGDKVVIKPNMVLHKNMFWKENEKCLYTNPSLVAAIIDYVIIALGKSGEIIVGDAPLQECDFELLINQSGYNDLIAYYRNKGINISLRDFRNIKTYVEEDIYCLQVPNEKLDLGILVKIDNESAFNGLSEDNLKNLRIDNFDPRVLQEHHKQNLHEYMIAKDIIEADVIINMPKPKTHRKAGVTISLKNLVGINAGKEYLPHHTLGSYEEGGDAYYHKSVLLTKSNKALDEKNILVAENEIDEAKKKQKVYVDNQQKGRKEIGERYWDGCWYGNDTIWRTICDLNRILIYADKTGKLTDKPQRKIFIVGDLIIGGQGEGPLSPTSIKAGTIAIGENPLYFDRTICSVMGIDYHKIPSLNNHFLTDGRFRIAEDIEPRVISNYSRWDKKRLEEIYGKESLSFVPSRGWEIKLGNRKKEQLMKEIEDSGLPIYVYGAGRYGADMYLYIKEMMLNVPIMGFFDSNPSKWGKQIISDGYCYKPRNVYKEANCVIAATEEHISDILKSASKCQFHRVFCWAEEVIE